MAEWMESYCYIRLKNSRLVKLHFNRMQMILMQFVAWRWVNNLNVKVITPKARQLGSSTFWECILYAMCELREGFQAAIVAHDDNGVDQLWGKIKTIKENLYKTSWSASSLLNDAEGKIKWTTEAMLFTGLIRSADALGKAGTPNAVHFSEVANFLDKGCPAEEGIASILSAMSETEWTFEIYESTAKGKDKVFWGRCEEARNPESGSALTLIFLPWILDDGYRMTWEDYRRGLVASGKRDPGATFKPTPEESALRKRVENQQIAPHERSWKHLPPGGSLTDEQLIWRRWCIANKCKNRIDVFKRYYPMFYEECFTASVEAAFSDDTIAYYRSIARPPIVRGWLRLPADRNAKAGVIPDHTGNCSIWQFPIPHVPYIVGGDPGGTKSDSDPYNAYVMNKLTREVVAQVHGHMEWNEFASILRDLGFMYNQAHVIVENNYNPAIANTLHQWGYPNLYYYFPEQTIDAKVGKVPGFNTNRKTRKEIVSLLRAYMKERLVTIWDEAIADEMENFVWVPYQSAQNPDMDGDYKAIGGNHDDRLMTIAMMCSQLAALIPQSALIDTPPDPTPDIPERNELYEWYLRREERMKAEQGKNIAGGYRL